MAKRGLIGRQHDRRVLVAVDAPYGGRAGHEFNVLARGLVSRIRRAP